MLAARCEALNGHRLGGGSVTRTLRASFACVDLADQPPDAASAAVGRRHVIVRPEAMQQSRGDDFVVLLGDEAKPFRDPRVDDALVRLELELSEHGVDRKHDAGNHRGHMRIGKRGELVAVAALEWTGWQQTREVAPQSNRLFRRCQCGTP